MLVAFRSVQLPIKHFHQCCRYVLQLFIPAKVQAGLIIQFLSSLFLRVEANNGPRSVSVAAERDLTTFSQFIFLVVAIPTFLIRPIIISLQCFHPPVDGFDF